ncbi:MAG: hypothetical protein EOM31_13790 [Bacteroidia bacterium]|nr:hypothetical protein [Bacteroidia bacterium]
MKQEINISSSARKEGTERSLRRVALDLFCFLFSFSLAFGLAVALAFLLTGCSDPLQEDDSESEGVNRTAIEFTTSVPPLTTGRGAPMGSTRGTPIIGPYDWCYTASSLKKNIYWNDPAAVLGTGKKSLFDPSPYGFRVPERGAFYSLSKVGNSTYNSTTKLFYTTRSSDYTATIYPLGAFSYTGATKKDSGGYYYYSSFAS